MFCFNQDSDTRIRTEFSRNRNWFEGFGPAEFADLPGPGNLWKSIHIGEVMIPAMITLTVRRATAVTGATSSLL